MRPRLLAVVIAMLLPGSASGDGTLVSWSPSSIPGMTQQRWDRAKERSPQEVLELNLLAKTWADCYEVALGARTHRDGAELSRQLLGQLLESNVTQLSGTSRLVIWERIARDEILFEGKGLQTEDDLFSVAGRANWVLRIIHEKNFGHVKPDSTSEDLKSLHARWREFLAGGTPAEWTSPYPTAREGLAEIRSLSALEALVVSLQPSREKDVLTKTCLRDIYGLDEMPVEEGVPARLCSPDAYIHTYLAALTRENEPRSTAWWAEWWTDNREKLVWHKEEGKFLVPEP